MKSLYIIAICIVTISCELIIYNGDTEVLRAYAPYLSPRGYPVVYPEAVTGELYYFNTSIRNQIDPEEFKGKIVLSDWFAEVDTNTIHLEKNGAIGAVYESSRKIGGRKISEFANVESFSIAAVDVYTVQFRTIIQMLQNGTVLRATLKADTNQWKETFNSGTFISYKVVWMSFHAFIIVCCSITLHLIRKNKIQVKSDTIKHNLIIMIVANSIYFVSVIDQFGQDQMYNHRISESLRLFANTVMLTAIVLYIIVMFTLVTNKSLEVNVFVKNLKFYYIFSGIFLAIGIVFLVIQITADPSVPSNPFIPVIRFGVEACYTLGCGIFYLVCSVRITKKLGASATGKRQMKKSVIYMFIISVFLIVRPPWQTTIFFFLESPVTYAVYFWVDSFLYAGIISPLSLQWIINYRFNLNSTPGNSESTKKSPRSTSTRSRSTTNLTANGMSAELESVKIEN